MLLDERKIIEHNSHQILAVQVDNLINGEYLLEANLGRDILILPSLCNVKNCKTHIMPIASSVSIVVLQSRKVYPLEMLI